MSRDELTPEEMEAFRIKHNLPHELNLLQVIDLTLRLIVTAPSDETTKVGELMRDLKAFIGHPDLKRHDLEGIKADIEADVRSGRNVLENSLAATGRLDPHE
mgnify:CR=1 FL=1|tara:strand:- start:373 stop:678 length:306 start_codon:yes stop_codon:yes gene_type:complete